MLDRIFSWSRRKQEEEPEEAPPAIPFGRYSDNNKSVAKVEQWNAADALFKEKKHFESIAAFFSYLSDEGVENVKHTQQDDRGEFFFYQGSKIIRGQYDAEGFRAEALLAAMPVPSVAVMRRLLEMNFTLYYTRYAVNGDSISMLFDSDLQTCNPSKLYYGLKELATKADKQDDLLVQDFTTLRPVDTAHIEEIPEKEKRVKCQWFKQWIQDTLNLISGIDNDKFSGGIAYLLLSLAYRIDYLIAPEGKLLLALEKIVEIYFRKDDRLVTEKNQDMMDCYQKMLERTEAEFFPYLFRSRYTFSIVTPQNFKTIADAIYNANQNIAWYRENKLMDVAAKISEYGISYSQYSYSVPRPVTEYFHLFMMVNYPQFFLDLGFTQQYYHHVEKTFEKEKIMEAIHDIEARWKEKYPELRVKTEKLKFEDLVSFNQTYTTELEYLNMETAR